MFWRRKRVQSSGVPGLELAAALHRSLRARPGNLALSPWSVSVALAMLQAGADGETRREIETALGRAGAGDGLTEAFAGTLAQLSEPATGDGKAAELRLANALWCQDGYPLQPAFVDAVQRALRSEIRYADFARSPDEAARQINGWAADATRQRIRDLLPGPPGPLTRAVLANAVYFKAAWLFPFEKSFTRPEPFRLFDGSRVEVPTMHRGASYRYASKGSVQALEVPYDSRLFDMVLLLPDPGELEATERRMDAARLGELLAAMKARDTALSLPRFGVGPTGARLRSALETIGIRAAFGPGANFSRVSSEPGFAVAEVFHSAFVEVDEKGTEAAAATAMKMVGASLAARRREFLEFRVDRPFLFLLRHRPSATILFMGRVVDPRE